MTEENSINIGDAPTVKKEETCIDSMWKSGKIISVKDCYCAATFTPKKK